MNYILCTQDVTSNLSIWNSGRDDIYKNDQEKLKHVKKIVFKNKFNIIFHSLSLCVSISIQNIGRSIPLIQQGVWIIQKIAIENSCKPFHDIIVIPFSSPYWNLKTSGKKEKNYKNLIILMTKKVFKVKWKAFLIIFNPF